MHKVAYINLNISVFRHTHCSTTHVRSREHRRVQVVGAREGSIRSNACCAGHSSGIGRVLPSAHHPCGHRGHREDQREAARGKKRSTSKTATKGPLLRRPCGCQPIAHGDRLARYCGARQRGKGPSVRQHRWGSWATGWTVAGIYPYAGVG